MVSSENIQRSDISYGIFITVNCKMISQNIQIIIIQNWKKTRGLWLLINCNKMVSDWYCCTGISNSFPPLSCIVIKIIKNVSCCCCYCCLCLLPLLNSYRRNPIYLFFKLVESISLYLLTVQGFLSFLFRLISFVSQFLLVSWHEMIKEKNSYFSFHLLNFILFISF